MKGKIFLAINKIPGTLKIKDSLVCLHKLLQSKKTKQKPLLAYSKEKYICYIIYVRISLYTTLKAKETTTSKRMRFLGPSWWCTG